MTGKEQFIDAIEKLINDVPDFFANYEGEGAAALEYFNSLKEGKSTTITENGQRILSYMQDNYNKYNNIFKAKDIGEGLGISSRSVTGSIRGLVNLGLVTKEGKNPVMYSLVLDEE
jgi:DNA-binding MarR family transcriptional regulator